jgi:CRISPR system Cascade subunit CasB
MAQQPRHHRAASLVATLTQATATRAGTRLEPILNQPGARSAIKRCLRKDPKDRICDHAWKHLARFVPEHASLPEERAFLTVAAIICAQNPEARQPIAPNENSSAPRIRSLGDSMAYAVTKHHLYGRDPAAHRLILLGRQNLTGIHRLLPHTALHLRKALVPIDWPRLIAELADWPETSRHTAKRWQQDYYRQLDRLDTVDSIETQEPTTESEQP